MNKIWNDYGIGIIALLLIAAFVVYSFGSYLSSKGSAGYESNHPMQPHHKKQGNVKPSNPNGQNEVYSSVKGIGTGSKIQDPSELLPKDTNSQWAQLNPSGKGELANANLLKAGYHIGIDTVGQTMRNANLQIRSEPPNPQMNVGPWNQTTIEPDFMRPPMEIGSGQQ